MTKLLWVALPLLAAAALLALQVLLRGRPTRHALNVWLSLLLLAYVATTAGLGIFWVANQQLPVFDWHYLFGYGTVLLVLLHLGFNFRVVWRHLTGARPAAPAAAPTDVPPRRFALGLLGVALASGAAFVFGLRHGRGGPVAAVVGAPPITGGGLDAVERFHAFSSHSRTGVLLRAPSVDWGDPPPPFKHYPHVPRHALPPPSGATGAFDAAAVGSLLWHVAGVTEERGPIALRASPSSGALFSTELYVDARTVAGLEPGWWHYDARAHALERLPAPAVAPMLPDAPALIVATAVFRRTGHKYRDRAWRYLLADLGHALENLRAAAGALGMGTKLLARFDESQLAAALGLDENEEGVLAVARLQPGHAEAAAAAALSPSLRPAPPAASAALGVTAAIYRASSLRAAEAREESAAEADAVELPRAADAPADVLALIAARRSRRRFSVTPVPLSALGEVLAGMARLVAPLLSRSVRVNLVANAVDGLASGAWRYDAARHALRPRRVPLDLRAAARAAALDQDVIGNAAAVFVLSIDRAAFAADPDGAARGYRHAFLEAGLVGERIYLEGGPRGLGVCAVGAFYDDEAAALVAIDPAREWVVHFAALGVPAA